MQQVVPSAFLLHVSPSLRHGMQVPFVPLHVSPSLSQHSKWRYPILLHGAPCGRQHCLYELQWPLQHCASAVQSGPLMKFWKSP